MNEIQNELIKIIQKLEAGSERIYNNKLAANVHETMDTKNVALGGIELIRPRIEEMLGRHLLSPRYNDYVGWYRAFDQNAITEKKYNKWVWLPPVSSGDEARLRILTDAAEWLLSEIETVDGIAPLRLRIISWRKTFLNVITSALRNKYPSGAERDAQRCLSLMASVDICLVPEGIISMLSRLNKGGELTFQDEMLSGKWGN